MIYSFLVNWNDWVTFIYKAVCHLFHRQEIDLTGREPDTIFVKEEIYDDHPIGQQMTFTDSRKSKIITEQNK